MQKTKQPIRETIRAVFKQSKLPLTQKDLMSITNYQFEASEIQTTVNQLCKRGEAVRVAKHPNAWVFIAPQ
jgi:predicted Zn-ribbon and HTH transcriptional regulator